MRHYRWLIGCTVLGIVAGCAGAFLQPAKYTSRASLQVTQPQLPEQYVPGVPSLDARAFVQHHAQLLLSRARLTSAIQSLDLYPSERVSHPMEDIIESMKGDIHLLAPSDGTIEISFNYQDRYQAQQVVARMTSAMIDVSIREAATGAQGTHEFLSNQADRAASEWTKLNDQARSAARADERLIMDRDLARKQYLELKAKLAQADLAGALARYHLAPRLELLDPASLPVRSDVNRPLWIASGACLGLLVGLALQLSRGSRVLGFLRPAHVAGSL